MDVNKNFFDYGGVTKQEFKLLEEQRQSFNYKAWKTISMFLSLYFIVLVFTSFSLEAVKFNAIVDLIFAMIYIISSIITVCFTTPKSRHLLPLVYFQVIALFIFGVLIGSVLSPDHLAVTFSVILVCVPIVVVDKPYKMSIIEVVMLIVYCICCSIYKTGDTRTIDIYNGIAFTFLGQFIIYFLTNSRIKQFLYAKKTELSGITDSLTGLYNRKAYQDKILELQKSGNLLDTVIVAMDLNGLKRVNDNLGHEAGDELIKGAAQCISDTFDPYGTTYRMGGDEFVAIINVSVAELSKIKNAFNDAVSSWKGEYVSSMTISTGYASCRENVGLPMFEVAKRADAQMYSNKNAYYRTQGIDRRGQLSIFDALRKLYAKILKVNLTDDIYTIIDMDEGEKTPDKGFSDKISVWLKEFGNTGNVHSSDVEEYLRLTNIDYMRVYFKEGNKSLRVFYRRNISGIYENVEMEIIPAEDYSNEFQSMYLFVKSVDNKSGCQ